MALNRITADELKKHLPGKILSLGYPDGIERLGLDSVDLRSVDIFKHRGSEEIVDLSFPVDLGKWDIVLDPGTIEHCSNPAQAFLNAANAVKERGVIIHESPLTMINHGYWNLCPVWFHDFYASNEFVIERFDLTRGKTFDSVEVVPWPTEKTDGGMIIPPDTCILVVARRVVYAPVVLPKCQLQWIPNEAPR